VTRVDELADSFGFSSRTLQRLLGRYVGVGPKWLLRRQRLHDAVAMIDAGLEGSLADLAAGLGWFDQNQFARDFARLVGVSPSAYRNRTRITEEAS
jgi:AraC-like DNA-binding protein